MIVIKLSASLFLYILSKLILIYSLSVHTMILLLGEEVKSCYMLQKHITYSLLNSRIFYIDTLCSEM